MVKILLSKRFVRQIRKLPEDIRWLADEKSELFKVDPFDPRLKTHKLHGRLADLWAFSIDYNTRVVFQFLDQNTSLFHSIGLHDIYD